MALNPVTMFPVSPNPFPVFVVVAFHPDLSAGGAGAYVNGCEGRQKGQADTKNQQFHFHVITPFSLNVAGGLV
jgi:hypothetical protein